MVSLTNLSVDRAASAWHAAKVFIEHATAIDHDTLHLLAGLLIWLVLTSFLRRTVACWQPLAATLVVAVLNEMVDFWVERWPSFAMQSGESFRDVVMTGAVPTLMFAAAHLTPRIFNGVRR